MVNDEAERWRDLASRFHIDVTAPAVIQMAQGPVTFTALFPQFGANNGMVVDADPDLIDQHGGELLELGYGFSAVEAATDDESSKAMFRDWGWSAGSGEPEWL